LITTNGRDVLEKDDRTLIDNNARRGRNLGPLRPVGLALLLGLVAGALFSWLGTPLPWMIGPLFATAVLRLCGVDLQCPVPLREAGQWAIGTALGL
jgi:hypothetical protein